MSEKNVRSFPVRTYVTDLSGEGPFYDKWYDLMPTKRKQRADRFRVTDDRKRCISAYALLCYAVNDLADMPGLDISMPAAGSLNISEDENGKPFFDDIPVSFNISHSKERVMVSLSPEKVGCDVECKSANALKIAKRFFSKEEYEMLRLTDDDIIRNVEFTRLWTQKESIVKCCGEGIRRVLDDFSLVDGNGRRKSTIILPDFDEVYHIKEYEGEGGYCYSVCSLHDDMEEHLRRVLPHKGDFYEQ